MVIYIDSNFFPFRNNAIMNILTYIFLSKSISIYLGHILHDFQRHIPSLPNQPISELINMCWEPSLLK